MTLADEVLTPDSSRFWPRATYEPGGPQPSYDKQFVRDYLESIRWNKQPPARRIAGCGGAKNKREIPRGVSGIEREGFMSWLDVVVFVILGYSIFTGFSGGFARVGVGFAATLLGIICGFWFYGIAAAHVADYVASRGVANLIGFVLVFGTFVLAGAIVGRILASLFKWVGLSWLDRLLGAAFGFLRER